MPVPPVEEHSAPPEADSEEEKSVEEERKKDTLSRATDWIRRNLSRVTGEIPRVEQRQGGSTSSWPERLQNSSRVHTRFVLSGPGGQQFTLGEVPGGIGSSPFPPDGSELYWISLSAEDDSIDPLHLLWGVDEGMLWVEDQNSVFGTVVTEPGRAALQCIPFERYVVLRGSQLQLGSVVLALS